MNDMPRFANIRDPRKPVHKAYQVGVRLTFYTAAFVLAVMLAATAFADGLARAQDAINNPHLEGF